MARVPQPRRGEIWQVRFDPSIGAEIRKQRPAVVLNPDGTGKLPLRIVVPITDWQPAFANLSWFVFLRASADHGLSKDSGADWRCGQVRICCFCRGRFPTRPRQPR